MIILLTVIIILILLLAYSIDIVYEISLENFDFSVKIKVKFPFVKEIYNNKNKKKKTVKKSTEKVENKRKVDLKIIKKLKNPVTSLISETCSLLKKHCRMVKMETSAMLALEDPMENGVAYGILSGTLNVFSLLLKEIGRVKCVKLDIKSDFDSGEGLILKNSGTLRVRPLPLMINVILDRKLIKDIKNILDIMNKEDNENG